MRKRLKDIPANSNGAVLSPKELLITGLAVLLLLWAVLPLVYAAFEKVELSKDFRLAYRFRDDYHFYRKVSAEVCRRYPTVFLGDSVIWGMYAANDKTLPAQINQVLKKDEVGNLAIDGLHPVALLTLVREYGTAITGKKVLLYLNPLWFNTPLYDLTGDGKLAVNHPRLLPQFDLSIKSYNGSFRDRCMAQLEESMPFYALLHHVRVAGFNNDDIKNYVARNPDRNPFADLPFTINPSETARGNGRINWYDSGIPTQNWPWVQPADSRQFAAFTELADLLKERKNDVTVVLGTINPYMQDKETLERYHKVRAEAAKRLTNSGFKVIDLPELPSADYADASHPLPAGYTKLAGFIAGKLK